jgi:hypothetical protein
MSKSTWTGAVSSDWFGGDNWSPAGVPDQNSDVMIATGAPVASATIGTVNSITDSSVLSFNSAGANKVATFLDDTERLRVDANDGAGGTTLNIGKMLTNSGRLIIGNAALSASDEVMAASLDNTGYIRLNGSIANQALLDVSGAAGFGTAGVLSGNVQLSGDSAIEFASGQITSLAAGALLLLNGKNALIEDGTAPGSNSALTGLANVAGYLYLRNGVSVSTAGALVNDGSVSLDSTVGHGGSSLTVGGTLTNSGKLAIGSVPLPLSASDDVTAASLDNEGNIFLAGNGPNLAALDVSGATTNNGSISITRDTEKFHGAVSGTGVFNVDSANLRFGASVSSGQTINESFADGLTLKQAQKFHGTISGFGTGDTIDAANFLFSGTTFNFVENSSNTGGTLSLHDAGLTSHIHMTGSYSKSDFTLAPDSGTGTLVKFA